MTSVSVIKRDSYSLWLWETFLGTTYLKKGVFILQTRRVSMWTQETVSGWTRNPCVRTMHEGSDIIQLLWSYKQIYRRNTFSTWVERFLTIEKSGCWTFWKQAVFAQQIWGQISYWMYFFTDFPVGINRKKINTELTLNKESTGCRTDQREMAPYGIAI